MQLRKLSIINFKNIVQASLEFTSRFNCLVGDNGAGKTNLVDAIHYLSMCKSAFAMTDGQCVRHGDDFFLVEGIYNTGEDKRQNVVCSFSKSGGKTIKRDGKEYDKLSEHIGNIPLVVVSPSDSVLVTDAAEERRRWMNAFLSQIDRGYLAAIMRYNRVLAERNRLLKSDGMRAAGEVLEILDLQLAEAGNVVYGARKALVERLAPVVAGYYCALSDDREQVELSYRSELDEAPFAQVLARSAAKDAVCGFTTSGVHRDDLKMRIGGHPLRKYGSQGQQKSFLVALKLAQYSIAAEEKGEKPILLLDDLFDKLDQGRVEKLLNLVMGEQFGQVFITDCNHHRLEEVLRTCGQRAGKDYSILNVSDGNITEAKL